MYKFLSQVFELETQITFAVGWDRRLSISSDNFFDSRSLADWDDKRLCCNIETSEKLLMLEDNTNLQKNQGSDMLLI